MFVVTTARNWAEVKKGETYPVGPGDSSSPDDSDGPSSCGMRCPPSADWFAEAEGWPLAVIIGGARFASG